MHGTRASTYTQTCWLCTVCVCVCCVCVCVCCVCVLPVCKPVHICTSSQQTRVTNSLTINVHHTTQLTSHRIVCTATSLNFTSYGRAARIASGEGVVREGRRELGLPSFSEKKRLKYASKPSSLLSAPLEGIEKPNEGYYHSPAQAQ